MVSLDEQYSIEESGNFLLIKIKTKIIDDTFFLGLVRIFDSRQKIGFDLKNVKTIKSKLFIKYLSERKFAFFNAGNEILVYISIVLKSNFLNSYINIEDLKKEKNEFIKRKFKLA